jgi:hypothetical protein
MVLDVKYDSGWDGSSNWSSQEIRLQLPDGTELTKPMNGVMVGLFAASNSATLETPRYDDVSALPAAMASLTSRAAGRPVVLELGGDHPLPDPTPLLLAGKRSATRICIRDPWWTWIVTKELVCTADEVATGQLALLSAAVDVPTGSTVLAELGRIVLSVPAESAAVD